jgi:xanthine/uracil permease
VNTIVSRAFIFYRKIVLFMAYIEIVKTLERLGVRKVARKISLREILNYPLLRKRVPNL